MKIQKKYIIAGAIAVVTVAGALAYLQYRKIMDYAMRFKSIKIKKLSATLFDFDLSLWFLNKSDLKFVINSQSYSVYLNDHFVTKLVNYGDTVILPKKESPLSLNVKFNPQDALKTININAVDLIAHPEKVNIKIDMKMKVSMWGLPISIPYVYQSTLKEMMSSSSQS